MSKPLTADIDRLAAAAEAAWAALEAWDDWNDLEDGPEFAEEKEAAYLEALHAHAQADRARKEFARG